MADRRKIPGAIDGMMVLAIAGPVATVTFDRPPVNAINDPWIARLEEVLDRVEENHAIAVLHFRSACKTFCAGADLKIMGERMADAAGRDAMIATVRRLQQVLARLEAMGTVSIAEIGGAALGGGLEFALACDLRVAAGTAKLGLPEAGLGLLPGAGGTQRLPRICGQAVARRLIFGAEIIDGEEAARLGLVQWAVPAAELAAWTGDLAARLGALPAAALAACKACIGASLAGAVGTGADGYELELTETRRQLESAETQARLRAFLAGAR